MGWNRGIGCFAGPPDAVLSQKGYRILSPICFSRALRSKPASPRFAFQTMENHVH
jgi:hypothetical protein